MAPFEERKAKERMATNQGMADRRHPENAGRTVDKLGEKAGVSAKSVSRAIKVRKHGTEEVKHAVYRKHRVAERVRDRFARC